jgi:hypothetical protein
MVLRRRSETVDQPASEAAETVDAPATGKGRPTPKRSDARKARRTVAAPTNRKEAAARLRERNREERRKQRQALQTGDERNLPARDAGPARRLARDAVDSRFTYGQVFFGVIFLVLVISLIPNITARTICNALALISLPVMAIDGARHARHAKRLVAERHGLPEAAGITSYAFMRALLPRRMRRPPPRVKRGDTI